MTTIKNAASRLRRLGAANASGDALRLMYAQLIADAHGGKPAKYYQHLTGTDAEILAEAKSLLADRGAAWDVLMA